MLTIKYLLENSDEAIERLAIKNVDAREVIEKLRALDEERRSTQSALDNSLAEQNKISKEIGLLMREGKREEAEKAKSAVSELKESSKDLEARKKELESQIHQLVIELPNAPHLSVPKGLTAEDNKVERIGGEIRPFPDGLEILPHWELAKKYDLIDFELGVKITGAGFPVYKGYGARLQRALINFFLDHAREAGYLEVQPPYVVNEDSGY